MRLKRIIDTFPAGHLKKPAGQNFDSLSEYSLKKGYGLQLRRKRRKRHHIVL